MDYLKVGAVVAYLLLIMILTVAIRKKTTTVGDFVIGSRKIGPWRSGFSYAMANFSAGLFIGFAGMVGWLYGGLGCAICALSSAFIATWLPWKVLAQRARTETKRLDAVTMPSYFEKRFGLKHIRLVTALIVFIFYIPYAGSLVMALCYVIEQLLGVSYSLTAVALVVVVGLYLFLGGYVAATSIDFAQSIVIFLAGVAIVFAVFAQPEVGGPITGMQLLWEMNPEYLIPGSWVKWVGIISVCLATGLGVFGDPDQIQRFMAIDSEKSVPKARRICTLYSLIIAICAYGIGSTGHLFFSELPTNGLIASTDLIVPTIIGSLHPVFQVLFLLLVLAVTMSHLGAMILAASSAVSIDVVQKLKPTIDERKQLLTLRMLTIIFLLFALAIALRPTDIIANLIMLTAGTVSGTFAGAFIYGLFSKKVTKQAVVVGMVSGFLVAFGGFLFLQYGSLFVSADIMAIFKTWGMTFWAALAIIFPAIVIPVVTHFTYRQPEELKKENEMFKE